MIVSDSHSFRLLEGKNREDADLIKMVVKWQIELRVQAFYWEEQGNHDLSLYGWSTYILGEKC